MLFNSTLHIEYLLTIKVKSMDLSVFLLLIRVLYDSFEMFPLK
nr:MAG TPA: hypothetical protein [Caudoviricetes sp.]